MVRMVGRLRTVLLGVAVLTLARVAYAQNIHIEIQGDPWKASQMEARKQYLRGREADEMIRKGYSCFRLPSGACDWEKLEDFGFVETARWGKCVKATVPVKGRMCERKSPHSSGFSYYDFERPLVLLEEKIYEAQSAHPLYPEDPDPVVDALRATMWRKSHGIIDRLPAEQVAAVRERLYFNFGHSLDAAFRKADPEGWKAAQAAEAAEAEKAHPALTPEEFAACLSRPIWDTSGCRHQAKAAEAKPAPLPVDESAESRWPPLAPGKSDKEPERRNTAEPAGEATAPTATPAPIP